MIIEDFWDEKKLNSVDELRDVLKKRTTSGCNEVVMYVDIEYPQLRILLKDIFACVHYFFSEEDCGSYASSASQNKENAASFIPFEVEPHGEIIEVSTEMVVDENAAFEIAKYFYDNHAKSPFFHWSKL